MVIFIFAASSGGGSKKLDVCDDFPPSVGLVNKKLYTSHIRDLNEFLDLEREQSSPKKSQSTRIKVAEEPLKRSTRSNRKSTDHYDDEKEEEYDYNSIKYKSQYKKKLDAVMDRDFARPDPNRREGESKLSYTYVLMDSRKICNAPKSLEDYADAVFYVGKGKNNRAFAHMKEAEKVKLSGGRSSSKKVNAILDIWKDGGKVAVQKVAENISAEEAFTREALLIDTLGKKRTTNVKGGEYYGTASVMNAREKRELGIAILEEGKRDLAKKGAHFL